MLLSFYQDEMVEAGCDEAGRGCLAGPVFAAAVILPKDFTHPILTDSKLLNEKDRFLLRDVIEKESLAFAVAQVDHQEIDRINILNASFLAMHKSLDILKIVPGFLIIDGNRFKQYQNIPHACIIQGDSQYLSIAAASILAKTYRDEFMCKISLEHPEYEWYRNKGYATAKHREAVMNHGLSPYHRRSFRITDPQLDLFD